MKRTCIPLLLSSVISVAPYAFSEDTAENAISSEDSLLELSLQELISLDVPNVTSVSRIKQRLTDSPAAVYVITSEDIKNTGVTSIPEALRMVPGMQVARLNSNTWSISTRGFNYIFANKLLVLIDGRTVYSPLFSGVNWDVQDSMLEDIARIEVIRGPGAALWGANAVNGVINIITKHAADTQGGLLSTGFGSEERFFAAYRYGSTFGEDGYYRAYYKTFDRDSLLKPDSSNADDDWHMRRSGFKTNWFFPRGTELSIQSDIYEGDTKPPLKIYDSSFQVLTNKVREQKGGNLNIKLDTNPYEGHKISYRAIYDNFKNKDFRINETRNYIDFELQHSFQLSSNDQLVWGLGYRNTWHKLDTTKYIYLLNGGDSYRDELYSLFAQNYTTIRDDLTLAIGSRFEHNDFTGFEFQPNARLTWNATESRTFWAALSRAVKTPSIRETELQTENINFVGENNSTRISIAGSENLKSETLTAFEIGYRETFHNNFRIDATAFVNQYDDILTYTSITTCPDGSIVSGFPPSCNGSFPAELSNQLDVTSYGLEVVFDWQVQSWWKLQFTYSWVQADAEQNTIATPTTRSSLQRNEELVEGLPASNTTNIRSSMILPNNWQLDTWVRYMDNMKIAGVDAYTALDLKATRTFSENLEFSIVGQNLFETQRKEFDEIFSGLGATEVKASWYLQLRWQH